ncbi:MAG TPA: hypothetical protein VF469_03750 [Kofleriaceae bacterium]
MPTYPFDLAPPPTAVDGLLAVPIDIRTIRAQFRFDAAGGSGAADATIEYVVGPTAGNPVFDLRQTITAAWLDGEAFPVDQLAAHQVTSAPLSSVRIIGTSQAAGAAHTLRVTYPVALPGSQIRPRAYSPVLAWSDGARLRWSFALSDLNAGRYLEAWAPANLLFDQYAITLAITITGTPHAHALITNGQVTARGANDWVIAFPDRFTALSPLVELHPADRVESRSDTVALPVSGKVVTVEAWRPVDGSVDLAEQIAKIQGYLVANEAAYGPYLHGDRFVAFFAADHIGGMEYEGGTTTDGDSIRHETFHSWFARGVKPAGQADGWWDEAFTVYNVDGSNGAVPFDFSAPPVTLCSLDPWQRTTPENSYTDGFRLWQGIAALLGTARLTSAMGDFYRAYAGQPASTQMLEELLVCRSGAPGVVDAFHRFVYGFGDAPRSPRLWLDDGDPGADGAGWNSPQIWVRNEDDGGTTHQTPRPGQDNWFYARVRNDAAASACQHAVVTFYCTQVAATQVSFPGDFLPAIAAKAAFAIAPGETQIVKARWPAASVPSPGSHAGLLAAAIARGDHPCAGPALGQGNLAVKNLTSVQLAPGELAIVPVVVGNRGPSPRRFDLEVWREGQVGVAVSLLSRARDLFEMHTGEVVPFPEADAAPLTPMTAGAPALVRDCGSHRPPGHVPCRGGALTSQAPEVITRMWSPAWRLPMADQGRARVTAALQPHDQRTVGLHIAVDRTAAPGQSSVVHLVERDPSTRKVVGGVAVEVRVGGSAVD